MKLKSLLFLAALSFGHIALADGFEIIQNGRVYRCEEKTNTNPGGAGECATKAYSGPFSKDESIRLCTGASGVGPAECAIKAYSGPFSKVEALEICSNNGSLANADCAAKAYSGPYSKQEAIKLCKTSNASLIHRSLLLLDSAPELREQIQEIKLQQQAQEKNLVRDI